MSGKMSLVATAKMTTRGRITIPPEVRRALGLEAGSRVEFVARSDGSWEIVSATPSIKDLKGVVRARGRPDSTEQMDETIADAVVESTP